MRPHAPLVTWQRATSFAFVCTFPWGAVTRTHTHPIGARYGPWSRLLRGFYFKETSCYQQAQTTVKEGATPLNGEFKTIRERLKRRAKQRNRPEQRCLKSWTVKLTSTNVSLVLTFFLKSYTVYFDGSLHNVSSSKLLFLRVRLTSTR